MGQRGEFADEEPSHPVVISRPVYVGVFPVTQAQFGAWTSDAAYAEWRADRAQHEAHENHFKDRPDHPAENLTWHEASAFCLWLNAVCAAHLPGNYRGALPSEAVWEYACRAGSDTEYWSGDGAASLAEVGWFGGNADGEAHPVGEKPANPFGLHDLHGNVWEWCRDAWDENAYTKQSPAPCDPETPVVDPDDGRDRVLRGGSWRDSARSCRSAIRNGWWPGNRTGLRGFRVCLVPDPSVQTRQKDDAERRPESPA